MCQDTPTHTHTDYAHCHFPTFPSAAFGEDASKPTSADLYLMWAVGCALWKEVPVNDHIKAIFAHMSALPAVAAAKAESDVAFAPKA
jgi:hypothetical protein